MRKVLKLLLVCLTTLVFIKSKYSFAETLVNTSRIPSTIEIQNSLGNKVTKVIVSSKIHAPVLGDDGQFLITLKDGREIGVVALIYEWKVESSPIFWVNLLEGKQCVIVPKESELYLDEVPSDWIASDYLKERKPHQQLSFLALNPRRKIIKFSKQKFSAETNYESGHPVSGNLKGLTTFTTENSNLRVISLFAYNVENEAEADLLDLAE